MDIFKRVFGKRIEEFVIGDLKEFFETDREETSILEFKAAGTEIEAICKEISAFLNTEGGILVIGAPREQKISTKNGEKRVCQGALTFDQRFKSKTSLLQSISSKIIPSPLGIRIFEHREEDGGVFVVEIQQSSIPPHQCSFDGRYYIRLEEMAKFAPHGLIQALFQKRRTAKLKSEVHIEELYNDCDRVILEIINISAVPAEKVHFSVIIFNIRAIKKDDVFTISPDQQYGKKFSYLGDVSGIVAKGMSYRWSFELEHRKELYYFQVGMWAKELDYEDEIFQYDPVEQNLISLGPLKEINHTERI